MATVDTLLVLLFNLACGRRPLYELQQWVLQLDPRLFGYTRWRKNVFNDDRFGRALDKLYGADRASLMTEIVIHAIRVIQLDLSRLHNDSTTLKAFGDIPGTTRTGLRLERGISKDHRPDLKQLVYCLTVSADGAVPVHYKAYAGNRTDDTTHIQTWNILREITGSADFLYVADCKVCTSKQLDYIVGQGGRVLTVMPDTWLEAKQFKNELREKIKPKKLICRRKLPGQDQGFERFSCFTGHSSTRKAGYRLYWIDSSEKRKRDRQGREQSLQKAEQALTQLMGKLNTRKFKTQKQILKGVEAILKQHQVEPFYHIQVTALQERSRVQTSKGRPGPNTRYKTRVQRTYTLSWTRNLQALRRERKLDGIFPLLCTDGSLTPKEALMAYKYQPRLEKRFTQFKTIHQAAPLLFKKIERVEAILFLFFLALMLQAIIERTVRLKMKEKNIDNLPIYPEHRLAYHPTTAIIFDRFEEVSLYQLKEGKKPIREFKDSLTKIQIKLLNLLGLKEYDYWP